MATLSAETVAQIAYQAGARGGDLEFLVGVAKRESGYNPSAHRTDSDPSKLYGDRGLWQINSSWDTRLMQAGIIKNRADLFDPVINAKAAIYVLKSQGRGAWAVGANGYQAGGDPYRGWSVAEAQAAVRNAQAQGLLGQPYSGSTAASGASGSQAITAAGLPTDTRFHKVGNQVYAYYQVAPGVMMRFTADASLAAASGKGITYGTAAWLNQTVDGGHVNELTTVRTTFGSFQKFWDSIINQVLGPKNPARNDPGVLRVIAELAGRPDMSEAELQNKLQATEWFNKHTQAQLEWNSLSDAEKNLRRQDTASRMAQTWFQMTGEQIAVDAWLGNARKNGLEAIASGGMTFGTWVEDIVKPNALKNPESPWSRDVRTEEEAQRQRGVDIENTAHQIRSQLERWGLQWSEATLQSWAREIVEKKKSDKDLMDQIRTQAAVLYPWKDPNIETATAAQPWIQTYNRVMEREGSVLTPEIQNALQRGVTVNDFITELKQSGAWMETSNAREELFSMADQIASHMGYQR